MNRFKKWLIKKLGGRLPDERVVNVAVSTLDIQPINGKFVIDRREYISNQQLIDDNILRIQECIGEFMVRQGFVKYRILQDIDCGMTDRMGIEWIFTAVHNPPDPPNYYSREANEWKLFSD